MNRRITALALVSLLSIAGCATDAGSPSTTASLLSECSAPYRCTYKEAGVIAGYQPQIDLAAAGFGVQCFVQLHIAQGELDHVSEELHAIPGVIEAWATTGENDILCRVAAASHEALQETLVQIARSKFVARSSSIVVLSSVVKPRTLPLLQTVEAKPSRAPRYPRS